MNKIKIILTGFVLLNTAAFAQSKKPEFSVSGTMGVTYEGYGLNRNPSGWMGYTPRRPWNQVRFNFMPNFQFGKNFSLPFNISMAALPTNFAGPYSGFIPGGPKQDFKQWLTNPVNNIAVNPKYKWAELQLGTQYLKYSELSTGDIGIFGAGFDLRPKSYRIKFFTGVSQAGISYFSGPPTIAGAYKRRNWMFQLGKEKEGKYEISLNVAKGKDFVNSSAPPPITIKPQEVVIISLLSNVYFKKGWYVKMEGAQSVFTRDLTSPATLLIKSFDPFIKAHTSTVRDYAATAAIGKKGKNFDLGISSKYFGAGFQTAGYPYLQPDRFDYLLNTKWNTWKNKMNIVASLGQRVNNISNTTLKANQFIGNLNWFTQFNDQWSLNINYNNFGFQSASGLNPYGIKNVSNDFGFSPTYIWSNTKMSNMLSFSYNYSKYDERDVLTGLTTGNNTHTALFTYVPSYFTKDFSPDFSVMYFYNDVLLAKTTLFTISSGLGMPVAKKKVQLRGQLQYNFVKSNTFKNDNNLIASISANWKINKQFSWNTFLSTNYFKYGNSILPNGANYLESTCRTGFQYKFDTKKK
ncbi:MAG: hypothetical protein ACOYLO_07530 [Ferruginibacter sp.]